MPQSRSCSRVPIARPTARIKLRQATARASQAPALIHEDSGLIKRAIRDVYNREIDQVLVEGRGGFDAAHTSGLSAGVWASNVNWTNTTLEVDLYANYGFSLSKDFSATVGYLAYVYEGNSAINTGEINASVSAYGLTAKLSHAVTDYFGIAGSGTQYYELNYAYEVAAIKGLSLALHYGVTDGKNAASNDKDYAIGLSYPVAGFTGTVSYSNGSGSFAGAYEGITAVTLKKTF